jgi:hypothetical protein
MRHFAHSGVRAALLFLVAGCFGSGCGADYSLGDRSRLELQVGGDYIDSSNAKPTDKDGDGLCGDNETPVSGTQCCDGGFGVGSAGATCMPEYKFESVGQGEPAKQTQVQVSNDGNRDLIIESIYMEEGGNPYITLEFNGLLGEDDFPITIEPDLTAPKLEFLVHYAPKTGVVDITTSVLIFKTNDERFEKSGFNGEFRMLFSVEAIGPKLKVDKSAVTYGCVTACSYTPIKLDNAGTDTLIIDKIEFSSPSSEFGLTNPPALPIEIPTLGDPSYNAVMFNIEYCPADDYWDDKNVLKIGTNDPTLPSQTFSIDVDVKQAPALLDFSTDSPFGYLDFSEESSHSINIFNKPASECDNLCADEGHCCGCSIELQRVEFDPEEAAEWYTVTAKDPTTDNVLPLPRALKGGESIQFDISYQKPAGHPEDKNATMCIEYNAPLAKDQNYCASLIAQSQCQFSLAPLNQSLQFNSASPAEVKEKAAVIINNGSAPCTISHVSVTNKWQSASEDYELKDVFAGGTEVAPFSVLPVWVNFSPHSDDLQGVLNIEYEDDLIGTVPESVLLSGSQKLACALPIADAGGPYEGYFAGDTITLDGCGSQGGDVECEGGDIFENGYVWYLLAKPENSASQLNTEGGCISQFIPDVAGTYELGFLVYDKVSFYQSDMIVETFTVQ